MVAAASDLRATLLNIGQEARTAGELRWLDWLRIRHVTQPRVWGRLDTEAKATIGRQIEQFVREEGVRAGAIVLLPAAGEPAAIDWSGLGEFLREILPVIVEFIKALLVLF